MVSHLDRDSIADLPAVILVIAASGIKLADDEMLSHWDNIILTPRCLETHTVTLAKANGNGPLLMLPFILYNWATNNLKDPPKSKKILYCYGNSSAENLPGLKQLVWWMLKSIRYDAAMFEEFTLAFFSLGWGRRGRETLGDLFPCFADHHNKTNLRLKILERIEIVDGILSNIQEDGSLTDNEPRSRAILFKGSNNVTQAGFDILIHQPRTEDNAEAILIVIKCKHTDALTLQELNTNLNVVACELAPFVKGVYP